MEQIKLKNMIIVKVDNGRQTLIHKKVIKAFVISRERYETKKNI